MNIAAAPIAISIKPAQKSLLPRTSLFIGNSSSDQLRIE
jgi:hypothetical protein